MSEMIETEVERRKSKSKMPQFISALVSKVRSNPSSKLVVDAVPVTNSNNSNDVVTPMSSSSDLTIVDPWQSVAQTPSSPVVAATTAINQMPITPVMISPNPNHLFPSNTLNAMSNSVTVNNVETQNNFNFSQINGLHIGSVYHVSKKSSPTRERTKSTNENCEAISDGPRQSTSSEFKKTKTIAELMQSTDIIDTKTLTIISEHMNKEWRTFLRLLNFSDGQIDQMHERFIAVGPKETIYRLLLEWSRNDDDATVGRLCDLLWKNQQQQCVMKLREYRKRQLKPNAVSDSNVNDNNNEVKEKNAEKNIKQVDSDSNGSDM